MPRYLIERTFPEGLHPPDTEEGADIWGAIVANNTDDLVTWIHSYVTEDKSKSFCIYEAPSPEAIRRAARRNNLPVDKIFEVRLLDPYSYPLNTLPTWEEQSLQPGRDLSRPPLPQQ